MPARRAAATAATATAVFLAGCASAGPGPAPAAPQPVPPAAASAPPSTPAPVRAAKPREPIAPPDLAYRLGLLPLAGTGVAAWRFTHPAYDGRGVLIAILDTGVDPGVLGLATTTTGAPKILDARNFSGEGDIALASVQPGTDGRIALPGGLSLTGAATVAAAAADSSWYGGVIPELPFGDAPAADFNGNGSNRDRYGVVVARGPSGWVAFIDTNGDGSLADETPIADYLLGRQTFTFRLGDAAPGTGPITGAVNLGQDAAGRPRLSLVLDTAGHGTHVAGIAAGHDLYGVRGFDGIAPGAQIIALKIADDARGGLSTTGSMVGAMEYAARFARERGLPLVLNMSFGVGNEEPGAAAMDSLVNAFLLAHPDLVFTISAGNDGPGAETMGLPASADFAVAVGAVYPSVFAPAQFGVESPNVLGWWSSRGGELDKPDIVAPGMAYSAVPRWNTGEEVKLGTSMAAPQAAGIAALLLSAMAAEARPVTGAQITQALRATARPLAGETATDQGYGVPQVEAAYAWLRAGHPAARYTVRALVASRPATGAAGLRPAAPARPGDRPSAAYRRGALAAPGDTVQRFAVARMGEAPGGAGSPATFRLRPDAAWLHPARATATLGADGTAEIEVHYDASRLRRPGRYVGAVVATDAADSAAGPAFRLVSEVDVPDSGQWRTAVAKGLTIGPDRAWRYFVDVPVGASALALQVALPDTGERGFAYLYEPSGRPSRTKDHVDLGGAGGAVGVLSVTSNDLSPGVWEAAVQAVPGRALHGDVTVSVPKIGVVAVDSTGSSPGITLRSLTTTDTTLRLTTEQLGVAADWAAVVERGGPYRRTFDAPSWATRAVVEVRLSPAFWNTVTDFGIIVYDRDGAQLGQGAMNYDFHRVAVNLPAKRGEAYPVTVELFPAFAHPQPPASFTARVRLAFEGTPRPLGAALVALTIPADGTARFTIPAFTSLVPSTEWSDLISVTAVGGNGDWVSIERQIAVPHP
jgi:tripeptidyl-peptidase-2